MATAHCHLLPPVLVASFLAGSTNAAIAVPTLPQVNFDATYNLPTGNVIQVDAGGDLQAAINNAQLNDVISLQAGATFTLSGNSFTLKKKTTGSGWIYIQTDSTSLPPPGTRVRPSDAQFMAKIVADTVSAFTVENGAHHYRLVGLEIVSSQEVFNLVNFGAPSISTLADMTDNMVIDRSYLHTTDDTAPTRRGVALNCLSGAVGDSYLEGFKANGADSQAIAGWTGTGPYLIQNNFPEGATENVIFGGADPASALSAQQIVPSDITIVKNLFFKRLSWFPTSPWVIKNSFELKNARRVLVEGNVFENNWANGQSGFAIVFTPRNQDNTCDWCTVEDVTFTKNIVASTCSGSNTPSKDGIHPSQPTSRILFQDNIIFNLSNPLCGGGGNSRSFQFIAGPGAGDSWNWNHNTATNEDDDGGNTFVSMGDSGTVVNNFAFTNNLAVYGSYGFHTPSGSGTTGLAAFTTNGVLSDNLIVKTSAGSTPELPNDVVVDSYDAVGFVDWSNGDFRLQTTSTYAGGASDGKDFGADIPAVLCAIGGAGDLPSGLSVYASYINAVCPGTNGGDGNSGAMLRSWLHLFK